MNSKTEASVITTCRKVYDFYDAITTKHNEIDFAEELIKLNEARKAWLELIKAEDEAGYYVSCYCNDLWEVVQQRFDHKIGPLALSYLDPDVIEPSTKLTKQKGE
jgi:hypothetical protein